MTRARDSADIISNRQQATAWCTFDGTLIGTNAPLAEYNVASVEYLAVGKYRINFTTPMDNVNFSVSGSTVGNISGIYWTTVFSNKVENTINSIEIDTVSTVPGLIDASNVSIQIFGGLNP